VEKGIQYTKNISLQSPSPKDVSGKIARDTSYHVVTLGSTLVKQRLKVAKNVSK